MGTLYSTTHLSDLIGTNTAYAPDGFKINDVCSKCNRNLGLFVDASFVKTWIVSSHLILNALSCFNPDKPRGLPFVCMGRTELKPPEINEDEVCELWLGALGEKVYWIRMKDERFFWYVGGNPVTAKTHESRAYFIFSERSLKNPKLTWLSFKDAFGDTKVKKIMCTEVQNVNPADIGFSKPDNIDERRINYFFSYALSNQRQTLKNSISLNIEYDYRFMAKLGLGIGYAIGGSKYLSSPYSLELRKELWFRDGDNLPEIKGKAALNDNSDPILSKLLYEKGAVTILIMPSKEGIIVNLTISPTLDWSILSTDNSIDRAVIDKLGEGQVILLYNYLQKGFQFPLAGFIAHKIGSSTIEELVDIEDQLDKHNDYFKNL